MLKLQRSMQAGLHCLDDLPLTYFPLVTMYVRKIIMSNILVVSPTLSVHDTRKTVLRPSLEKNVIILKGDLHHHQCIMLHTSHNVGRVSQSKTFLFPRLHTV